LPRLQDLADLEALHASTPRRMTRMIPMHPAEPRPAWSLALLALAVGCAPAPDPTAPPAPSPQRWTELLTTGADGESAARELAGELVAAGVEMRVLARGDLSPDESPTWAGEQDEGWIVQVRARQRAVAEAVREAWLARVAAPDQEAETIEPFAFGPEAPLEAAAVAAITAELAKRRKADQAVRRDPDRHAEMRAVDADNTAWLRATTAAHGWIDAARFGPAAAEAAFLIVQHSGDRALMAAALPRIEHDVQAGRLDAQGFALLYDRLQLMAGEPQRYGTQILQDAATGTWYLGRLEAPERVDELRRALGLGPLEEYLAGFGHQVQRHPPD
jgi:hypothetical protein